MLPSNTVWTLDTERSGYTWLSSTMGKLEGHVVWSGPSIGNLYHFNSREKQRLC